MVVGLRHFARSTGCRLIAEGIKTDRELAALRALYIGLGQGGLLGRPLSTLPVRREPRQYPSLSSRAWAGGFPHA